MLRLCAGHSPARENARAGPGAPGSCPCPRYSPRARTWAIYSFLPGEHLTGSPAHVRAARQGAIRALGHHVPLRRLDSGRWVQSPLSTSATGKRLCGIIAGTPRRAGLAGRTDSAGHFSASSPSRPSGARAGAERLLLVSRRLQPPPISSFMPEHVSGVLDWEFAHAGDFYMGRGQPVAAHPIRLLRADQARLAGWRRTCTCGLAHPAPSSWTSAATWNSSPPPRADDFKRTCVAWVRDFTREIRPPRRSLTSCRSQTSLTNPATPAAWRGSPRRCRSWAPRWFGRRTGSCTGCSRSPSPPAVRRACRAR